MYILKEKMLQHSAPNGGHGQVFFVVVFLADLKSLSESKWLLFLDLSLIFKYKQTVQVHATYKLAYSMLN